MDTNKNPSLVVDFVDESPLATDLKQAIVSLQHNSNTQYRLHICLNGEDGYTALQKLVANPSTKIRVYLLPHLVLSGNDLWLNTKLFVSVGKGGSDNYVVLSPQQTGCVVRSLPEASKKLFLEKITIWYRESFLKEINKGLETITKQIETGNLLLESDDGNRVFDIHGDRSMKDIPYTETEIVGENLYWAVVHGHTFMEHGCDGYDRADGLIVGRRERQKAAVDGFLTFARSLH